MASPSKQNKIPAEEKEREILLLDAPKHSSLVEARKKVFEWDDECKAKYPGEALINNPQLTCPRLLPIFAVIFLLFSTAFGIWAILHPIWISTSGKVLLPPIKIPITKKSIVCVLSLKLDMALYKVCMDLNVTVAAHHLTELEKSFMISIRECHDKDNVPHGLKRDKMMTIMIDFIHILLCLMSGTIHAFIAKVLLIARKIKKSCCTHYIVILVCSMLSAVSSVTGVIIANRRLTKDAKFFFDLIDLSTNTKGHAADLLAAAKGPLLQAIQDNFERGSGFDVATSFAVFSVISFSLILLLALLQAVSKRTKRLANRTNV